MEATPTSASQIENRWRYFLVKHVECEHQVFGGCCINCIRDLLVECPHRSGRDMQDCHRCLNQDDTCGESSCTQCGSEPASSDDEEDAHRDNLEDTSPTNVVKDEEAAAPAPPEDPSPPPLDPPGFEAIRAGFDRQLLDDLGILDGRLQGLTCLLTLDEYARILRREHLHKIGLISDEEAITDFLHCLEHGPEDAKLLVHFVKPIKTRSVTPPNSMSLSWVSTAESGSSEDDDSQDSDNGTPSSRTTATSSSSEASDDSYIDPGTEAPEQQEPLDLSVHPLDYRRINLDGADSTDGDDDEEDDVEVAALAAAAGPHTSTGLQSPERPKRPDTPGVEPTQRTPRKVNRRTGRRTDGPGRSHLDGRRRIDDWTSYFVTGTNRKPSLGLTCLPVDDPEETDRYMRHHCLPDRPCRCRMPVTSHVCPENSSTDEEAPLAKQIAPEELLDERDRIARAIYPSSYVVTTPDGKKRRYTYDGRPMNSRGLPTHTELETEMFFRNGPVEYSMIPDITRDKYGRRYEDYPTDPRDFHWLTDPSTYRMPLPYRLA